ncbi:MAG: O-antigen ligase family protein [Acidimicrobiales bacterium]
MMAVSAPKGAWVRRLLGPAGAPVLALTGGLVIGALVAIGLRNPLILGAVGVLVIGVAVLLSPTVAVALLVGVVYTRASDLVETELGLPSFVIPAAVATAGLMYYRRLLTGETDRRLVHDATVPALLLVLAWLGIVVLGVIYAVEPDRTWARVVELVRVLIVFFCVVVSIRRPDTFRAAGWAVIVSGGLMAVVNVFQVVTGTFDNDYLGLAQAEVAQIVTGEADAHRIGGPLASPNFFALVLIPVVSLAWSRMTSVVESPARRAFAAGCGALSLVAMVLTFSRGALVGLAVIAMILVWRARPTPRQWAALALVGAFAFLALPSNYKERAGAVLEFVPGASQSESSDPSLRGRTSEVTAAWQMFLDHPVVGVGAGNYETRYQAYAEDIGLESRRVERQPHSLPLEIAAEHGLIGLAVFGLLLWVCMTRLAGAARDMRLLSDPDTASMMDALWLGMVGWLASSVFLQLAYPRIFWVLLALVVSAPAVAAEWRATVGRRSLPRRRVRMAT